MSAILARENFIFNIGATFRRRVIFDTDENLSAFTARLQVRSEAGAADLVLELTTDVDGGLTMGSNYLDIEVPAGTAVDLSAVTREGRLSESADECEVPSSAFGKIAVYDLKLYSDDDPAEEYFPLEGEIVFRQAVTEDA